jgi:hypothetical protein
MRQKIITLSIIIFLSSMLILSVLMISAPGERLRAQTILSSSSPSSSSYDTLKASDREGLRNVHGVKIVSPIRGQKVPADKNLTVIGTSIANSTSNCLVSFTLNGIAPYQRVKAIGPNGTNDYTLWGFVITPNYAPIKVGANQLKAKFSCVDNPTLISYYTTNITGIASSNTTTPIASTPTSMDNNNPQTNCSNGKLPSNTKRRLE